MLDVACSMLLLYCRKHAVCAAGPVSPPRAVVTLTSWRSSVGVNRVLLDACVSLAFAHAVA